MAAGDRGVSFEPAGQEAAWRGGTSRWLIFVFLLAASVRLLPAAQVFDSSVYFYDGDCYDHLRKITLQINEFPRFVTFDYYSGYPVGSGAVSPPLLDYILAALCLVVGLGDPIRTQVEYVAALSPPIVGGLTAVAVYLFARRIFGHGAAALSSVLIALMPEHIISTVVGRPDNEMTEPLMVALLFLGYRHIQEKAGAGRGPHLRAVLLTSLAGLASLLFWRGATLWIGLLWAAALIDAIMDVSEGNGARSIYRPASLVFLLLSAYLFLICYFNVWGTQGTFSFNTLSWFHVSAFAFASASLFAFDRLFRWRAGRGAKKTLLYLSAGLLGLALIAALGLYLSPSLRENLSAGLGIVGIGRKNPWLQTIVEYKPLFHGEGSMLLKPVGLFGWAFWVYPLITGHIAYTMFRKGPDRGRALFVFLAIASLFLALLRVRFANVFSVAMAIGGGYMLRLVYGYALRMSAPAPGRQARGISIGVTALASLVLFYPLALNVYALPKAFPGFKTRGYIEDAMLWLRDETPSPGDPYGPGGKPAYSVLARWDFEGWLTYIAQRPAVATLFGTEKPGFLESAEFNLAETEEEANSVLEKVGARYVVVTKDIGDLATYARLLGRAEDDYASLEYSPSLNRKIYRPGRRYFDLIRTSLLISDGMGRAGGFSFKEAGHYRLVYESAEKLPTVGLPVEIKKLKIFEYVPGAMLSVRAPQGLEVSVEAMVTTNRHRVLGFKRSSVVGGSGEAAFVLPYAPPAADGGTGLSTPYTVRAGGYSAEVVVSEEDVAEGRAVSLSLP